MGALDFLGAGLGIGAGTAITDGLIGAYYAKKAGQALERGAQRAQGAVTNAYGRAQATQQPFYDQGVQGLNRLAQGQQSGSYEATPYDYQIQQAPQQQFNFEADPGYQFRLQQGMLGIGAQGAARGTGLSSATLKAMQRYGSGLASQEYSNAFNRFANQRDFSQGQYQFGTQAGMTNAQNRYASQAEQGQNRFARENTIAGYGQAAGNNLSTLATGYGQSMADIYGQQANAQAGTQMGIGQAYGTTANRIGGLGMQAVGWQYPGTYLQGGPQTTAIAAQK